MHRDAKGSPLQGVRNMEVMEIRVVWGKGVPEDPFRAVVEYWSMQGHRLAVYDPLKDVEKSGEVGT